jgi:hypothetical protein
VSIETIDFAGLVRSLLIACGVLIGVFLLGAAVISWHEGERRAARRLLLISVLLPLPYLAAGIVPGYEIAAAALLLAPAAVLLLPVRRAPALGDDTPTRRIDERDIMFSRHRLQPGTERFEDYYRQNPDKKALDERFRAKPGLLNQGANLYNSILFSAAGASFTAVSAFHALLDHAPAPEAVPLDPAQMAHFLHWWGKKLGGLGRDHGTARLPYLQPPGTQRTIRRAGRSRPSFRHCRHRRDGQTYAGLCAARASHHGIGAAVS